MSDKERPAQTRSASGVGLRSFPDVAGEWAMVIHWNREGESGCLEASAFIRQDDLGIGMTVRSKGSDSRTILAVPGHDPSGDPVLHYIYEVEPKAIGANAPHPYKGAAILRYFAEGQELSGNYWTSQFSGGHFRLSRKSGREGEGQVMIDVVLIAAIPEEFEAAKKIFSAEALDDDGVRAWQDERAPAVAPHISGVFYHKGEPLYKIALARPDRMGGISTSAVAAVLAERLSPRCLVMCGVCAGNPGDLALGDIVISELAYQYDEGKLEDEGFVGDHRQSPVSADWQTAASLLRAEDLPSYGPASAADARFWLLERLYAGDDPAKHPARSRYFRLGEWQTVVTELLEARIIEQEGVMLKLGPAGRSEVERSIVLELDPPKSLPLAIKVGPIASGNVVVKDGLTWDKLRQMGVRTVLGLEMEAAAVGRAARRAGVEWIVIKGVMDHADPKKSDRYKPFAAQASAEALRLFLTGRFNEWGALGAPAPTAHAPNDRARAALWRPRTFEGPFFDALRAAIAVHAPSFAARFDLALSHAREARDIAATARQLAGDTRMNLAAEMAEAMADGIPKPFRILRMQQAPGERPRIVKIWDSHDDFIGEAAGDEADGLGVTRSYALSEELTPSLRSAFAGQHETGRYGPLGVFTFPDHSQFAGEWASGHPNFGCREYMGRCETLRCDLYIGSMKGIPDHLQPRWLPDGEGIAIDAGARRARCGTFREGTFSKIGFEFDF
ncbi:phosphorylase family protein [Sphingopyxis sp. NJF-3]